MASGPRRSPKTTNDCSAGETPQREPESAAPCRSHQRFSGGPFQQGVCFSAGGNSETASKVASSYSTQGLPKQDTAAAHVVFGSVSHPSSRQWSFISSFRDVRGLSPVYSSEEDRCSPHSMSRLFSQSTFGYEFDQASLSHRVSSIAEDRQRCVDVGPCQRYALMMFLVAVLVACVTAVVVDMRWTTLSRNHWAQLLVDPNLPMVVSPVEGNVSVKRTTYFLRTTVATGESSSSAKERAVLYEWMTLGSLDDNVTVASDVQEETTALIMKVTQPPSSEENITGGMNSTVAPTQTSASLPRQPSTTKRRSTQRPAALSREEGFHSRRNVLSAPIRRPTKHKCGLAFYTYCLTFLHEAYYRHTTRSCVRTLVDDVHVCNHSPNRFTSRGECEKKCVHTHVTSDACFEKTLFSWCNSDRQEKCRGPGDGVTCDSDVLRFPYFADMSPGADGHVRCVRASAATLLTHRCLIGSNRFSFLTKPASERVRTVLLCGEDWKKRMYNGVAFHLTWTRCFAYTSELHFL
ncbi:hypothetical protein MRX96_018756 [Rhipicephalus microplus]